MSVYPRYYFYLAESEVEPNTFKALVRVETLRRLVQRHLGDPPHLGVRNMAAIRGVLFLPILLSSFSVCYAARYSFTECPPGAKLSTSSTCTCMAGYYGVVEVFGDVCVRCPADSFCPANAVTPTSCPTNTASLEGSTSQECCSCKPGKVRYLPARTCKTLCLEVT